MLTIMTFSHQSTKALSPMLYKSFIISVLTYCLPVLFTCMYAKHKKRLRKFFGDGKKIGIDNIGDLDTLIDNRSKNLIMNFILDDEHFINDFLTKLPSGRYRAIKYRSSWGRDCFLRSMISQLNKIF